MTAGLWAAGSVAQHSLARPGAADRGGAAAQLGGCAVCRGALLPGALATRCSLASWHKVPPVASGSHCRMPALSFCWVWRSRGSQRKAGVWRRMRHAAGQLARSAGSHFSWGYWLALAQQLLPGQPTMAAGKDLGSHSTCRECCCRAVCQHSRVASARWPAAGCGQPHIAGSSESHSRGPTPPA